MNQKLILMLELLKKNLLNTIILVLLTVVVLQRCEWGEPAPPPSVKRDTVWVIKDSTVYSKPQVIKTIPVDVHHDSIIKEYIPDTNYSKLVVQYQNLVQELLAKNIYKDSLKIDSIGYVHVTDTVTKNNLTGRSYNYNLKYPIIKETITIHPKPKNQLYVGGAVMGNQSAAVNSINAGVILKTKQDQILGVTAGLNTDGQIQYGVQSYWKLKLKK